MLAMDEIDMVVIGAPNLPLPDHGRGGQGRQARRLEKPLCLNLAEADRMIAACAAAGVKLMYAEELCLRRSTSAQATAGAGRWADPLVKQSEKHDGPHAPHFWDVDRSGGGVTHGHGLPRHRVLPLDARQHRVKSVYAQMGTRCTTTRRAATTTPSSSSSSRTASSPWPRKAGPSSAAWTTAPRCTARKGWRTPICCTATRSRPTAEGLRLRGGKGRQHEGLELHDVRGGLELRLSAGDPAFRRLRAERQAAAGDGRRRQGGPRDLRGVRVRRLGPQDRVAVLEQERISPTICGRSARCRGHTSARMTRVHHCRNYQDMSREAAARVIAAAAAKSDSLLCVPAGNSPAGLYQELIRKPGGSRISFEACGSSSSTSGWECRRAIPRAASISSRAGFSTRWRLRRSATSRSTRKGEPITGMRQSTRGAGAPWPDRSVHSRAREEWPRRSQRTGPLPEAPLPCREAVRGNASARDDNVQ